MTTLPHVLIASDHAGYTLKEQIIKSFSAHFEFENLGCYSEESVDYPDFAHQLAHRVDENPDSLSILICGTGNGVAMTANKYINVRAALCWNKEIAVLARQHNNANILVLPARFIKEDDAFEV